MRVICNNIPQAGQGNFSFAKDAAKIQKIFNISILCLKNQKKVINLQAQIFLRRIYNNIIKFL